jgi:hypothetical protein
MSFNEMFVAIRLCSRPAGAVLLLLSACGSEPTGDETIAASQQAVLGVDTHLYFRCNATGWAPSAATRLVASEAPGEFRLNYEVKEPWMTTDQCTFMETNQLDGWGTQQTFYGLRGTSQAITVPGGSPLQLKEQQPSIAVTYPSTGRYTITVNWRSGTFLVEPVRAAVLPQRSLLERNPDGLSQLSLASTFDAIAVNSATQGGARWYDNVVNTFLRTDGSGWEGCDSEMTDTGNGVPTTTLNGFFIPCVGAGSGLEGKLAGWKALSAVNRFDLAPEGGEHCGEQRLSFFLRNDSSPSRAFMIFEAVIPNPAPELGLEGCRPIVDFWARLSDLSDPLARSQKLAQAFYTGEPTLRAAGFEPFMNLQNLSDHGGRVRTNMFASPLGTWHFSEFRLLVNGGVKRHPVAQSLPEAVLRPASNHPKKAACEDQLVGSVSLLLGDHPNALAIDLAANCFSSESTSRFPRAEVALLETELQPLRDRLVAAARVVDPATTLTAEQLAMRLQFGGTCVGCHHVQPKGSETIADFGNGMSVPAARREFDRNSFTQVSELEFQPCSSEGSDSESSCFKLSPVLSDVFLPQRKQVIENYLRNAGTFTPIGRPSRVTIAGAPLVRGQD